MSWAGHDGRHCWAWSRPTTLLVMTSTPLTERVPGAGARPVPALELVGLRKSFGDVRAVSGVDLVVHRGEVVALLGPNGAGKSTTVDLLLGLTTPDAGAAHVFGDTPRAAIDAGRVGAMLQSGG